MVKVNGVLKYCYITECSQVIVGQVITLISSTSYSLFITVN